MSTAVGREWVQTQNFDFVLRLLGGFLTPKNMLVISTTKELLKKWSTVGSSEVEDDLLVDGQ